MEHNDTIIDQDSCFFIDPITRNISAPPGKRSLIQYDHNSERFTFRIPKLIESHDMSSCDKVEIHFSNVSADRRKSNNDVYPVDDISVDGDDVTFSWLISSTATKIAGSLHFLVRFVCYQEEKLSYAWSTNIFSGIAVSGSFNNNPQIDDSDTTNALAYLQSIIDQNFDGLIADIEENKRSIEINSEEIDDQQGQIDGMVVRKSYNILCKDLLEQGNINYLTGAEMDSNTIVRTDFIRLDDNVDYMLSAFSKIARFYVIYYDTDKNYLGYGYAAPANNSFITKLTIKTAEFDGSRYIRVRFEANQGGTFTLDTLYKVQLEKGTDIGHYVPANDIYVYNEEYNKQIARTRIFFDDDYDDTSKLIASAVKEVYIPDETYKGELTFSKIIKKTGINNAIGFYTVSGTLVYTSRPFTNTTGEETIEIPNANGGESAYIIIDWDKVPDGTSITSKNYHPWIFNDSVYDKEALQRIQDAQKHTNDASGNLTMFADKFRGGETETNLLKFHRNYNIPKKGLYMSTDAEYYKGLNNDTTDEERIKGLIPYLYFNGKKIGTVVLYDETTGAPFVYLADGTKKTLS